MRKFFVVALFFLLTNFAHADHFTSTGTVDVYFSPDGGTTNAIISELNNAKSEILVQAYSFTCAQIAKALIDAKKQGKQSVGGQILPEFRKS